MTSNKIKAAGDYGDVGNKANEAENTYKIINRNQYKIINIASTSKCSTGKCTLRQTRWGG